MTDVAAIISRLEKSKTTAPAFRWNLPAKDAYYVLGMAYKAEVEKRGRQYESNDDTKELLCRLAQYCVNPGYKLGALLCGTFGNGKTTMLYALQQATNALIDCGYCTKDMGIQIIDANDLLQIATDYKAFKLKRDYPVLGIEDLGKEPVEVLQYGNHLSPIIDLLEYRYAHLLPTFITSNLAAEDFKTRYDERIASRLRETMEIISFPDLGYRNRTTLTNN